MGPGGVLQGAGPRGRQQSENHDDASPQALRPSKTKKGGGRPKTLRDMRHWLQAALTQGLDTGKTPKSAELSHKSDTLRSGCQHRTRLTCGSDLQGERMHLITSLQKIRSPAACCWHQRAAWRHEPPSLAWQKASNPACLACSRSLARATKPGPLGPLRR